MKLYLWWVTHAVSYLDLGVSSLIIDPQHLVLRKRKIREIKKQKNKIKKMIKKVKRGRDEGEGGRGGWLKEMKVHHLLWEEGGPVQVARILDLKGLKI